MIRSPLHIVLIQFDIQWEDPLSNRTLIEDRFAELGEVPDLVILPEMFTTGFTMNVSAMAETMSGESVKWMMRSAKTWDCEILGSLIIEEEGRYFNRLLWVGPDGVKLKYDKRHLFAMAGEDKVFSAGNEIVHGQLKGWEIRPLICYDVRFPVWSRSKGETDIIIYIANFPAKRRHAWRQLLIARAIENQCFVIGLNRVGWDGMQHFYSGDSLIVNPQGKIMVDLEDHEKTEMVELNDTELENIRHELPFLLDADQFDIKL